jgi:hypothetical protein
VHINGNSQLRWPDLQFCFDLLKSVIGIFNIVNDISQETFLQHLFPISSLFMQIVEVLACKNNRQNCKIENIRTYHMMRESTELTPEEKRTTFSPVLPKKQMSLTILDCVA